MTNRILVEYDEVIYKWDAISIGTLVFWPGMLFVSAVFVFTFKKYLSVQGVYYIAVISLIYVIIAALYHLNLNTGFGVTMTYDFGRVTILKGWIDFRLLFVFDLISQTLSAVVAFLTILAITFGVEYMCREAFVNRVLYLLMMFTSSVLLLFIVYDFFLLMLLWEAIGVLSFLLVNHYSQRIYTMKAAYKTFIYSRISDLAIFTAYVLIVWSFESTDFSVIFYKVPFYIIHIMMVGIWHIHFLFILSSLITIAGAIKAAQFYSHVWLPDAMEAPTPASALIHSSTLVIMGIYLIIRFSILFEFSPDTNYYIVLWGGYTIAFGAITASVQDDMKKLVAYSTISQMGYLMCGCGYGAYEEVLVYLISHAVNKAFLFILVGYTVHYYNGNTDFRQISHSYFYASDICIFIFFTCLNLMGLPYVMGFYAKEFLVNQTPGNGFLIYFVRATWCISFYYTPKYMLLLALMVIYHPRITELSVYWKLYKEFLINLRFLPNEWKDLYGNMPILNMPWKIYIQYCIYTSRATVVFLVFFFSTFNYLGEYIFLTFYNVSSVQESIQSSLLNLTKQPNPAAVISISSILQNNIFLIIILFTFYAIKKLLHVKYERTNKVYIYWFFADIIGFLIIVPYMASYVI